MQAYRQESGLSDVNIFVELHRAVELLLLE